MATNAQSQNPISEALRKITYGYYILTTRKSAEQLSTRDQDYIAAGTVCWVTQVSFEPHMVMVAVEKTSDLNETIQKSRVFALQRAGPQQSAAHREVQPQNDVEEEAHQLNDYAFEDGKTGSPLLTDTVASFRMQPRGGDPFEGRPRPVAGRSGGGDHPQRRRTPAHRSRTPGYKYGG
jgi:flavin reductase (DIM6/NTAB) family NADH-FMN oxidoreductase RutF